jgi:hypothetical protein
MTDDDYKSKIAFLTKELILYQQRAARAQFEVKAAISVARGSLTESQELLRKVDVGTLRLIRRIRPPGEFGMLPFEPWMITRWRQHSGRMIRPPARCLHTHL